MKNILEEMKGKKAVLGTAGARGGPDLVIVTIIDVDDKFIKVKTEPPKTDQYDIVTGIISYIHIDTVNSIVDISTEAAYKIVMSQMAIAEQEAQRAHVARQQKIKEMQEATAAATGNKKSK